MNRRGKLFLGGGGNEDQSFALDQKFAAELGDNGHVLYLPIAQQGDSTLYASCFEWFTTTMKRLGISADRVTMVTSLTEYAPNDFATFRAIYIGDGMTGTLCRLMWDADMKTVLSGFFRVRQLSVWWRVRRYWR